MTSLRRVTLGKRLSVCALALACHAAASAGSPEGPIEGPFVVWINLSKTPQPVDTRVRAYLDSGKGRAGCWGDYAMLYMRRKPAKITEDLVRRAVLRKDRKAMRTLNDILEEPFDDLTEDGMDGVIVYDDAKGPTYYGYTRGKKKVAVHTMRDLATLEKSMCAVLPPVTRGP